MTATDKITDFALTKMDQLFNTVAHTLPVATKYALEVTSYNCLINVLTDVGCAVGLGFALTFAIKNVKEFRKSDYDDGLRFFLTLLFGVLSVILIISTLACFDMWDWVGIWHPDLYLINKALQKAL